MNRREFNVLYLIQKSTVLSIDELAKKLSLSTNVASSVYKELVNKGYLKKFKITTKGLKALNPYKVKTAIIMAAGRASRFVPISFEKPKGLLKVKGEILIERQINQLVAVGIKNIVLVLGYKKELFYYLKEKYPFIKIVINNNYDTKNNIETLYLARKYLGNAYICSSDDYFTENPFDLYVYEAYYAGHFAKEITDEFYMELNSKGYIKKIYIGGSNAIIMFGHAYFDRTFASAFVSLMEKHHKIGDYDQYLWDVMLMKNLKVLPPMYGKLYPYGVINEFDSLEDLRKFDKKYIDHTGSAIMRKISKYFKCREGEITNLSFFKKMDSELFKFKVKNKFYIYDFSSKKISFNN